VDAAAGAGCAPMTQPLIRVVGLTKSYGGLVAIDGVDFSIASGEVMGVIGPNGAGKSTLIGLLGGALTPSAGSIHLDGIDVTAQPAAVRARHGIGRTYQIPRPFLDMTVRENLLAAHFALHPFGSRRAALAHCDALLERTGLADMAGASARALPLLRRKRLEVARALTLRPRLLLLDEVAAGLIDSEINDLIALVKSVASETTAIIIIEHVMRVVRACCQRLMVLNFGKMLADGPTGDVLSSDEVGAIYLGTAHRAAPEQPEAMDTAQHAVLAGTLVALGTRKSGTPLVALDCVAAGYGQARVLRDISFSVGSGEAVAILGPNGAGKTTLAGVLSGAIRPTAGRMLIDGRDVTGYPAHRITGLGISQCLEGRRIFAPLSVEENLLIAARRVADAERRQRLEAVYELFPILRERRHTPGTSMSGGQQQMLAIGRALMARPRLVVFDEISLGLAPVVVDRLYDALRALRDAGLTMLVVEQDIDRALDLVDRVHVLEGGRFALSGTPDALRADVRLRDLYIGVTHDRRQSHEAQ